MRALLREYGQTYAAEAGIQLKDTPQPLYRMLVLASLLSARIRASVAVATTRALYDAGLRDPRRMVDATWRRSARRTGGGARPCRARPEGGRGLPGAGRLNRPDPHTN